MASGRACHGDFTLQFERQNCPSGFWRLKMVVTDHPDVQRLIAKTVEFQADIKQLEIYLDNERAKNKQLTTKLTEIEAYGCYVEDESGHTCGMAAENKRLREALESVCSRCSHLENVVAALKKTEDK